jgi:hypothetical protein
MRERKRQLQRQVGSSPTGGLFDDATPAGGSVDVIHGPYRQSLPVAEMPISEVRRRFQDHLDIHPEAVALVGGHPVDDTTRLRAGQTLMFVRPSGEKGGL